MKSLKTFSGRQSGLSRITLIVIAIFLFVIGSAYIGLRIWIKADINQISELAMAQFEGEKVEALIAFIDSDSSSLNEKNRAIWALGKLNDERALPVLHSLKTGEECNHAEFVCQRELEKAISNLEGKSIDLLTFKN